MNPTNFQARHRAVSSVGTIDLPKCMTVSAKKIADKLLSETQDGLKELGRSPLLVGFLSNDDDGARAYAEWTGKTARSNGFDFSLREVPKEDLEEAILKANKDDNVDGIIVYYPIFGNRHDQYLQQIVDVDKDVEGLSHRYIFNMYQNVRYLDPEIKSKKSILPCTPLAVLKILEHLQIYNNFLKYGNRLHGRTVTVINRSEVVGRPLAALLANDGACVYSVDIDGVQQFTRGSGLRKRRHEINEKEGWKLDNCLPISDVVISGVPGDKFKVPLHLLREGACCINFSSQKNFDPEVKERASIYVPAIGSVTIAVLFRNLLRLVRNKADAKQQQQQQAQAQGQTAEQKAPTANTEPPAAGELTARLETLPLHKKKADLSPDVPGTPVGMEQQHHSSSPAPAAPQPDAPPTKAVEMQADQPTTDATADAIVEKLGIEREPAEPVASSTTAAVEMQAGQPTTDATADAIVERLGSEREAAEPVGGAATKAVEMQADQPTTDATADAIVEKMGVEREPAEVMKP